MRVFGHWNGTDFLTHVLVLRDYLTRFARVVSSVDVVCSKGSNLKMLLEISAVITPDVTSSPFTGACTSSFHDKNWMSKKKSKLNFPTHPPWDSSQRIPCHKVAKVHQKVKENKLCKYISSCTVYFSFVYNSFLIYRDCRESAGESPARAREPCRCSCSSRCCCCSPAPPSRFSTRSSSPPPPPSHRQSWEDHPGLKSTIWAHGGPFIHMLQLSPTCRHSGR